MGGGQNFKCHLCKKVYKYEKKLKRHIKCVHMESGDFECLTCRTKLTSATKLTQHSKLGNCSNKVTKRPQKIYLCNDCDETFRTVLQLRKHVRVTHNKNKQPPAPPTKVYFEGEEDAVKCLHAVPQQASISQATANEAETTWR